MISLLLSRSFCFSFFCESSSFLKLIGQKNCCVCSVWLGNNPQVFACGRFGRCSGFGRVALVGFEFQLVHRAVASRYIVTNLAEILRLDELSIGSGMAVEVSNLNDLPLAWKRVTLRYSHSAHEALAVFL